MLALSLFVLTPKPISAQTTSNSNRQVHLLADTFDMYDPLKIGNSGSANYPKKDFSNPGKVISEALNYAFPLAGLILFVMIIWGGFEMLAGAATAKSKDAGRQRVTAAVAGFFLLFAAYWITQIIEVIFGVKILGQ